MGKSTINEPFSIAMLVYQRVVGMIQSDVHSMIFQRGRLKPPTMKNVDECCESTTLSPFSAMTCHDWLVVSNMVFIAMVN